MSKEERKYKLLMKINRLRETYKKENRETDEQRRKGAVMY